MLPESALESFKAPDVATVSAMVDDYEVTAEKLSSVRYIGTYTISFRPAAVERYLNVQGQSYTNVVSAPLVILPFYQVSGKNFLWSPYNIWMRAWNRAPASGAPVPVIVPIGDLEDVSDIGDDDVFGYNPVFLRSNKAPNPPMPETTPLRLVLRICGLIRSINSSATSISTPACLYALSFILHLWFGIVITVFPPEIRMSDGPNL